MNDPTLPNLAFPNAYRRCAGAEFLRRLPVKTVIAIGLLGLSLQAMTQNLTQNITLQPGWNAIFIELQPEDNAIDAVFSGLDVRSVWRFEPKTEGMLRVSDPGADRLRDEGWRSWYSAASGRDFLTNLFTVRGWQAYLVDFDGSTSQTLTIVGKPTYRPYRWATNGPTFTGFPVDPSSPPLFGTFFAASAEHLGARKLRLLPSGSWEEVTDIETIQHGMAYFVDTNGASEYQGPLRTSLDTFGALSFGSGLTEDTVSLVSEVDDPVTITLTRSLGGSTLPIVIEQDDPDSNGFIWPDLGNPAEFALSATGNTVFRLGLRRVDLPAGASDEIIELNNGLGVRRQILVAAEGPELVTAKGVSVDPYSGLWIGNVIIDKVSESQQAGTTPEDAGRPFPVRMLLHVDATGQVRLLKHATKMWSSEPTPENFRSGQFALISDPSLLPGYEGVTVRDNEIVGVRYSTVAYDFVGLTIEFVGSFGPSGSVGGDVVLPGDHPTNPFYHRYHPDHDNLDAQFTQPSAEAQAISRTMNFAFDANDGGNGNPGLFSSEVIGLYTETVEGLHRNPIYLSGRFRLERVSDIAELNGGTP